MRAATRLFQRETCDPNLANSFSRTVLSKARFAKMSCNRPLGKSLNRRKGYQCEMLDYRIFVQWTIVCPLNVSVVCSVNTLGRQHRVKVLFLCSGDLQTLAPGPLPALHLFSRDP